MTRLWLPLPVLKLTHTLRCTVLVDPFNESILELTSFSYSVQAMTSVEFLFIACRSEAGLSTVSATSSGSKFQSGLVKNNKKKSKLTNNDFLHQTLSLETRKLQLKRQQLNRDAQGSGAGIYLEPTDYHTHAVHGCSWHQH